VGEGLLGLDVGARLEAPGDEDPFQGPQDELVVVDEENALGAQGGYA